MKKIYLLLLIVCFAATTMAQTSSANYSFATTTTGSLALDANGNTVDMTTGTTTIVVGASDDAASAVTNLPFEFWFFGNRFTQYTATSNGLMALGSVAAPGGSTGYSIASGTPTNPRLGALCGDLYTGAAGKVHSKVVGTAPNRCLVIEFNTMAITYSTAAGDATSTYQVRLYESTGVVEYVYGAMARTAGTLGGDVCTIGFSAGTLVNTSAAITSSTNTVSYAATFNTNTYTVNSGAIPNLNSVADGSRRVYTFTPSTPVAPSSLNFTAVTATGMTLNWTDNSTDESGFAIYRSTDGTNYTYLSTTAANATSSVQGGLAPSTNYFWRVNAVREIISTATSSSQTTNAAGNITSTGTGGLWNAPGTWVGGVVPTSGDNVTIVDGATVTIDLPAAVCLSLTVGGGTSGALVYQATPAATLTVGTDVTVLAGASFNAGAGVLLTHTLSLGGNLINNGVLDLSTTAGVTLTFTGAANSSFTGTGATTDLYILSLAKAARAQEVELNLSNFTVRGLSAAATGALLTSGVGTGTLKISGTNTFNGNLWSAAAYSIPATLGFWLNNPNFTVNGQAGSPTVAGLFRISQGTYNIGTGTGNSMGFSAGSVITVEGGAINATGRFGVAAAANTITYTQTGTPVITVCTVGNTSATLGSFDLGTNVASTISMTGGTIICQLLAGGIDYRMQSGTGVTALTGGTLQLGNASSGAAKIYNFRGVLPRNTIITNTSAGHTLNLPTTLPATYNYLVQNLTINTGTTFTHSQAGIALYSGNVVNNGTFTATAASSRVYNFANGAATTWSGTGTFTAAMNSFEVDNVLGVTLSTTNQIPTNRIILFSGAFTNSNKITLGNGGATTGAIQIGNTTTPTNAGIFDAAPTFNLGTGGQTISYLRTTTVSRSTGPEVNTTRSLTTMTYDDNDPTHTLTVAGGNLSATTLNLTNGKVITDASNVLTVAGTTVASVTRTTGYVSGPLARTLPASLVTGSTYLYPVGKSVYTPMELVNPTTNAGGTVVLQAEEFDGSTGGTVGTGMQSLNSNVYWNATITTGAANFTNTTLRLTDAGIGSANAIGKSSTQTGAYDFIGGNSVGIPVNTITSDLFATFSFFVMGVKTPPACVTPSAVSVTGITSTSANVNFTCVSCTGTYIVEYGAPGFTPGTGATAGVGGTVVTGAASPIALSSLTAATAYQVYVRQDCGAGSYSANSTVAAFTTLCNPFTLPYTENFDAVTAPAVPNCSLVENVNGGTTWATGTTNSRSTPNNLTYTYDPGAVLPGDDWWYTPGFNLTGGTSYRLAFWYRARGASFPEALEVKYGNAQNAAAMTSSAIFTNLNINNTTYTQAVVDFTPASNGVYYLGFHNISTPDQFDLHVDDIAFDVTPACPAPAQPTMSGITFNSAIATWAGAGSYILEYGPTGYTPGTAGTAGATGTLVDPAVSPQSITGLAPSTTYDLYVRLVCAGPTWSANSPIRTFTTSAAPLVNDDASGAISLTVGAGCTGNPYTNLGSTQSASEPFPNCSGSVGNGTVWYSFVAPTAGAVKITNDYSGGTQGTDTRIALFSTTNVNDYTTFTNIACDDDNGSVVSDRSILYATGLTPGNTYYILVDGFSTSTTKGTFCLTVDNIASSMLSVTNTCASTYQTPSGANAYTGWASLVDANGNLIALVRNPVGSAVSNYTVGQNINTGAVRTTGGYYLDRNFRIANATATNVDVQLFFLATELAALTAADPTITLATLGVNKQTEIVSGCYNNFSTANGSTSALVTLATGTSVGADVNWIQFNTPSFSNFYLNKGAVVLPISVNYLQGTKQGTSHNLNWKVTCTSSPSATMVLERSGDNRTFKSVNSITADALRCAQPFNYVDASPLVGINYYRLRITDAYGKVTYSNTIAMVNKQTGFDFVSISPNPVTSNGLATLNVASAQKGKLNIVVTDVTGRVVLTQNEAIVAGSNLLPINVSKLAAGSYQVTAINEDGNKTSLRFIKQ